MEQNIHRKGLVNWLLLLVGAVGALVLARYCHSATGLVAGVFIALGFLVAAVSYFQMRLEYRERLEQMEFDELNRTSTSRTLFTEVQADTFPARRAREQFERFIVPAFALVLFVLQAGAFYLLWKHIGDDQPATGQQATVAMAVNALLALVLFQFGKYSAVLGQLEKQRLLRPQASYLLLGALLAIVTAAVEVAGWAEYPRVDVIVARVLTIVLGLVAIENLLSLVFETYRPRVKGQAEHPLYESRLIGLLSQPGGLITTAAQALDYQFGFKVSETWFYRYLERALAWLVLGQVAVLVLSTSFAFVELGEHGVLERFGRPVAGRDVLDPGLHLKWPWPIDKVYRFRTDQIQTFLIGLESDAEYEKDRVLVWTKSHAKEEAPWLVASKAQQTTNAAPGEVAVPVNLLAVNIPVQYQVHDVRAFAYNHVDAGNLLEDLANEVVTRYLVSVDIDDVMTFGRKAAAEDLRRRIQERADALQLGVKVLFLGLHGIHPPVKVAPDFERVIGALQDREATNLYARAYMATNIPVASGRSKQKVSDAQGYYVRTTAAAEASAQRFENQMLASQASPEVYRVRTYLDTLGRAMADARTYVVALTNTHGVAILNLEEKLRKDLLDIELPKPRN
ncbi:MAG TPA: protease modulator HflK [Verrucomicrobiota bacterium]|nr:protease modulator HflK [Verrucomicrobiota bacterium]HRZ56538.1 protease modulator HflK [Candidatus Paceibacterota bacterium]